MGVVRIVDVGALGRGTPDPVVLAHCAKHGFVWVTSDEAARGHVAAWISSGNALPGVIIGPQRHRISPGRFVRFLERLAAEQSPFAGVIRYVSAEDE